MALNDNDLELLHEYVDGELPVPDCEGLWRRLAIERDLASELERLRADHAVRAMVWNSLQPDDKTVARLEAKIMRSSRREDLMSWAGNALRIAASAAALILFGISIGWMGRDRYNGPVVAHAPQADTAHVAAASMGGGTSGSTSLVKYNLQLKDASGKLLPPIQFDSREEAMEFVRTLMAAQASPNGNDWNVEPGVNKF